MKKKTLNKTLNLTNNSKIWKTSKIEKTNNKNKLKIENQITSFLIIWLLQCFAKKKPFV